jgi:serine/threonine protein kinase/tetratricopeptide (TPR) repeat protein
VPLSPEDWRRVEALFDAAAALPASRRREYLADVCPDNAAVRQEVERLIASDERAATFLESPATWMEERVTGAPAPMPDRIGRYRIDGRLGEGGMGVVYAGFDEELLRPIALKVIRHEAASDAIARQRFTREARLAASVNHPHICQLYEIGEADGHPYIAMERLEGESLTDLLARGAAPVAATVKVGLELLDALDAVHRRGIVHRDLKPSNIFLTPHGVKVLDFGVSLGQAGEATQPKLTAPGAIIGTPRYLAPEQVLGHAVSSSADIFAAGAILYEMLSGIAAFPAESIHTVLESVLHGEVPALAGSPAIVAADRVLHRALAKAPVDRYSTAAAMAEDLRMVLAAAESAGGRPARPVTRLMVLPFRLLRPDAEIDFLSFSLADAVANSLSPLQSLVVRSTIATARFQSAASDLETIAREGNVDVILTGTLLRSGEILRVSAQLIDAPSGTVAWSHTVQAPLGEIFQLQDGLARQIVESLSLPLSGREQRAFGHDIPSNAKAFEFYLRANPLSHDSGSWEVARDLYLQCLQSDPNYAPAWARLGRVYHVIGKYRGTSDDYVRSESALNRALELNPDLSIADHFYAQLEVADGRAQDAMVRLVRRASSHSSDPDLFAALVPACRYCGLLQHSLAAYERATRLDPNVRTSVEHTLFLLGKYERCAAESERSWAPGSIWNMALACGGHIAEATRVSQIEAQRYAKTVFGDPALVVYPSNRARLRSAVDALLASGFRDLEGMFYQVLKLAHAGDSDRAVEILGDVVDLGFYPYQTLATHAWLDALRERQDFKTILQKAEHRHLQAHALFVAAGGEALLGASQVAV